MLTALRRERTSFIAVSALQFGGALCFVAHVISSRVSNKCCCQITATQQINLDKRPVGIQVREIYSVQTIPFRSATNSHNRVTKGHGYLYNVIINVNNRKNLTIYLGMIQGKLIVDQYWNTFLNFWKNYSWIFNKIH